MEAIGEVIDKKGSIKHLWKIIDPDNHYPYKTCIDVWYRLDLTDQRKLCKQADGTYKTFVHYSPKVKK